jgi:hypothetical protein
VVNAGITNEIQRLFLVRPDAFDHALDAFIGAGFNRVHAVIHTNPDDPLNVVVGSAMFIFLAARVTEVRPAIKSVAATHHFAKRAALDHDRLQITPSLRKND